MRQLAKEKRLLRRGGYYFPSDCCIHLFRVSCPSGQLVDFIKRVEQRALLSCDTVLKIFYQSCRAVQHMHKQKPPIIHRDLKVRCSVVAG